MKSARERWFERLHAERDRRRDAELMVDGRDPREVLLAELALIGARLRAAPDYRPPTPEETAESDRVLDQWFRDHSYGVGSD